MLRTPGKVKRILTIVDEESHVVSLQLCTGGIGSTQRGRDERVVREENAGVCEPILGIVWPSNHKAGLNVRHNSSSTKHIDSLVGCEDTGGLRHVEQSRVRPRLVNYIPGHDVFSYAFNNRGHILRNDGVVQFINSEVSVLEPERSLRVPQTDRRLTKPTDQSIGCVLISGDENVRVVPIV